MRDERSKGGPRPRLIICCCCWIFFCLLYLLYLAIPPPFNPNGIFLQIPCTLPTKDKNEPAQILPWKEITEFPFPKVIHMAFEYDSKNKTHFDMVDDWTRKNPGFLVKTYDLSQIHSYVRKHKPDMFENFILLEKISQIDFWRYLVMLVDGGLYVDSDVTCLISIDQWLGRFKAPLGLLVGLESVVGSSRQAKRLGYIERAQISNWLLLSKPGHPFWDGVLQRIVQSNPRSKRGASGAKTLLEILRIVKHTGPGRLTKSVVEHLNPIGITESYDFRSGAQVCEFGIFPHGAVGAGYIDPDLELEKHIPLVSHAFEGSWKLPKQSNPLSGDEP